MNKISIIFISLFLIILGIISMFLIIDIRSDYYRTQDGIINYKEDQHYWNMIKK